MAKTKLAIWLLACVATAPIAPVASMSTELRVNPIRKVVNMLQSMQEKVKEEGEKADELFQKYMCFCKNGGDNLRANVQAADAKLAELGPATEAAKSKVEQLRKDLATHQVDRKASQKAMEEATAIREKESKASAKELAETQSNLGALNKAIPALEHGMDGSSFLQTSEAAVIRDMLMKSSELSREQQDFLSFLSSDESNNDEYGPQSGEIVGMVKQLKDSMTADEKDIMAQEKDSNDGYNELMAAKTKEVSALSKSVQEKQDRLGRIGIEIAEMKADKGDTAEALEEDKAFLRDMDKNCKTKEGMYEEEKTMRGKEEVALAETIKILNDDDALEIFKKSMPSAASSFLQLQTTSSAVRAQAWAVLNKTRSKIKPANRAIGINFISLALSGRKVGFDKIIALVDNLLAELKREDAADEQKKSYCEEQLDITDGKKKVLVRTGEDLHTSIEEIREGISKTSDEIETTKDGVIKLDKCVAEATEQRKKENAEYKQLMAANAAAKELILFARKRLSKFYQPTALVQTSSEEAADSFVQLASSRGNLPPPPETMQAYTKKSTESSSVIGMLDLLIKNLDTEMLTAKKEEEFAQEDYERTMQDSGEKRAIDTKGLSDKEGARADMKSSEEEVRGEEKATDKEVMATDKYLISLHSECDFVLQYFDVRKQARADEIDSLEKAKDVLSGADVSLLQRSRAVRVRKFLRHGHGSAMEGQ